jgi:poly(3-hydroxybutyrate) depolymerase
MRDPVEREVWPAAPRALRARSRALLMAVLVARLGWTEDVPAGRVVAALKCLGDAGQSYAVYVPSSYSAARAWPVIFAFDPGGRGTVPVERYQAAAEKYGYIVAGSNNSRNGPWEVSMRAARAMMVDAGERFRIDDQRVYLAGMSGGSRVALGVALGVVLGNSGIAGVIASSAGFPDSKPRKSVEFPVFGTAGTEDFNLSEMRQMDRALTSAHRLAVFEGGHMWLSSELAMEAVEWMEVRQGSRVDEIFAKRTAAVEAMGAGVERLRALQGIVADFGGVKDVSSYAARAKELERDKGVREALKKERDDEALEERETRQILGLEAQLGTVDQRGQALLGLRSEWKRLSGMANGAADTVERRRARRVLRGLSMGARERASDAEYQAIVAQYRPGGR